MSTRTYKQGERAALRTRTLPSHVLRRLRDDMHYWEGFHHARPQASHLGNVLEDPTRPGGWCTTELQEDSHAA